jgi:hypothetical protein
MSTGLMAAGNDLANVLAAENAALAALDFRRAVGMFADKRRATDGFVAAQGVAVASGQHSVLEELARRLQSLAAENKALLTRAMAAQTRVMGVLARAGAAAPSAYGVALGYERRTRPAAYALVTRA